MERPLLIVDPSLDLLLQLKQHALARKAPPILLSRADQVVHAIQTVRSPRPRVLLNPRLDEGRTIPIIIQTIFRTSPLPQIFLFCDRDFTFSPEQMRDMGITQIIMRTPLYTDILRALHDCEGLKSASLSPRLQSESSPLHRELNCSDDQLVPFQAHLLNTGELSYFDIFHRTGENQYRVTFKAGDVITREIIRSSLNQGITEFYARRNDQRNYREFLNILESGYKQPLST